MTAKVPEKKTRSIEVSAASKKLDFSDKGSSKSLLFIDDNPLILETIRQLIESSPYELLLKDDPFDGLCALARNKPLAVFIDAGMRKLDGYQFCALVKAQSPFQFIPLVIILEHANKIDHARALAAGANAVLIKPFGKNELLNTVHLPGVKAA